VCLSPKGTPARRMAAVIVDGQFEDIQVGRDVTAWRNGAEWPGGDL